MKHAPCLDCKDRYLACHSMCAKYKAFRAERDGDLERQHKEYEKETDYFTAKRKLSKQK